MNDRLSETKLTHRSTHARARHLLPDQLAMIEEALGSLGEYGEVRLVVERGQIRFITVAQSFDALKWRPVQGGTAAEE